MSGHLDILVHARLGRCMSGHLDILVHPRIVPLLIIVRDLRPMFMKAIMDHARAHLE